MGVKGSDQSQKALAGTQKGLGDIASSSLQAKAAIVGVIYGLERMMSHSAKVGMGLQQFENFTGLSTDALQRWQYAARQSGVSAEEMTSSIKGVQQAIGDMLLGKGAPEGMGVFARAVGFDMSKAKDTFYVLEKLKEFSRIAPPTIANPILKSFGLGENTVAFLKTTKVELDKIKPSTIFSPGEIGTLSKVEVAWSNFGREIEMAMGHLTAKRGLGVIADLSKVTKEVFKLVDALVVLSEKVKVFETMSHAAEGVGNTIKLITEIMDKFAGKESKKGDLLYTPPGQEAIPGLSESPAGQFFKSIKESLSSPKTSAAPGAPAAKYTGPLPWGGVEPTRKAVSTTAIHRAALPTMAKSSPTKPTQNINVKQDLHFQHEGKDAKQTGDSTKKAIQDAYRQMHAQGQGA